MNERKLVTIIDDERNTFLVCLTDEQIKLLEWLDGKNFFYEGVSFNVSNEAGPEII